MRVAVQAMDKDDVDVGWSWRGDFGQTKAVNGWNLCFGRRLWGISLELRVEGRLEVTYHDGGDVSV